MVFHDQTVNIDEAVKKLDENIHDSGFAIEYIHTGPVIRREFVFENNSLDDRRKLVHKLLNFYNKMVGIVQKTFAD